MNSTQIEVEQIIKLQKDQTVVWHRQEAIIQAKDFYEHVEKNHLNNFLLWHEEDKARRDDKGFEYVYRAKRNIDRFNQQRNNCMEAMDEWVFHHYQPLQSNIACHSETPGMMIDRLSIIALKAYHMQLQANRAEVDDTHRDACRQKLKIIHEQWQQLSNCLKEFLHELSAGTRTFRVYHQFKMYNDPKLNPQLYQTKDAG